MQALKRAAKIIAIATPTRHPNAKKTMMIAGLRIRWADSKRVFVPPRGVSFTVWCKTVAVSGKFFWLADSAGKYTVGLGVRVAAVVVAVVVVVAVG